MTEFSMLDMGLWGYAIRLSHLITTVIVGWYALRLLDIAAGVTFKESLNEMRQGNTAVAVYYGLRILALAHLGQAFF